MRIKLELKSNWIDILVLLTAFICQAIKYSKRTGLQYNSDSVSYFYPSDLWAGEINPFRMWVYPTFIQWLAKFGTENLTAGVLFFNFICSIGSIVFFYLILKRLLNTRILPALMTLFFAQWDVVNRYLVFLLPESFCVFLSLFICYVWLAQIRNKDWISGITLPLLILFAIFTKPAFLPLMPLYLLYLFISFNHLAVRKRIGFSLTFLFSILIIWSFAMQNQKKYGYNGISMVSLNNNLANTFQSGGYKYAEDKELVALLDENAKKGFYSAAFLLNNFSVDIYRQYLTKFPFHNKPTDDMIFMNSLPDRQNFPFQRLQHFVKKAMWNKTHVLFVCKQLKEVLLLYKSAVISILTLFAVVFWVKVKNNKYLWEYFYLCCIALVIFLGTAIGGIDDWDRLLVFVFPIFIVLYAIIADLLLKKIKEYYINYKS